MKKSYSELIIRETKLIILINGIRYFLKLSGFS